MAILVNMGQRGFILKEGFLAPGKEIVVDSETGEKLVAVYKSELKLIKTEPIKEPVEEMPVPDVPTAEEVVEEVKEEVKVEPKEEAPKAKRKYTRKAK